MADRKELTTTSYAILGLLGIRPWTTYELAQHMGRSLGRLWPRAQSKIYEEPKKLVEHGLARASEETVGRRPRTVYTITPRGRRALKTWLEQPGAPPSLEFEALMKIFFSDSGSKEGALTVLDGIIEWASSERALHAAVAHAYLDGEGPFQQRAAQLFLTGKFLVDFNELVLEWGRWARSHVERWPDDPRHAQPDWDAYRQIAEDLETNIAASNPKQRANR